MSSESPSEEVKSRKFTAPDDNIYTVHMEAWYWNSLDWMNNNTEWSERDFLELAWKTARQMENDGTMEHPGNFQEEFALAFKSHVGFRMTQLIEEEGKIGVSSSDT